MYFDNMVSALSTILGSNLGGRRSPIGWISKGAVTTHRAMTAEILLTIRSPW